MSRPFKLESFEKNLGQGQMSTSLVSNESVEDVRLAAFEQGYKAGWDDSHASYEADQEKISADFARNLNELSFTYHEVRSTIIRSLEPLLREMVSNVIPKIAQTNLGELVSEQIMELVDSQSTIPVELLVSAQDKTSLEMLSKNQTELPITIMEETSLASGQVFIRMGGNETQFDISAVLEGFENAIGCFFDTEEKELAHG